MKLPKIPLAQTVIKLCELRGIKHIVISPGSRSAPLTIGFTNHPFFKCYSIVDERSAGFFALGIAQQINEPVALVCTSGSALLNYFPAIAEAFYSDIPLVVLSADRPEHLIGIGDGQTIDQKNVYGSHCLYHANLKEDIDPITASQQKQPNLINSIENKLERFVEIQESIQEQNEGLLEEALNRAIQLRGPVHVNVPFNEPLYETVDDFIVSPKVDSIDSNSNSENKLEWDGLINTWNSSKRKMILVGTCLESPLDQDILDRLLKDEGVVLFTETTSNIHHDSSFNSIDKIIAPLSSEEFKKLQPDILVTFGGMIVSKKIKAFLREYQPKSHWHIDEKKAFDTFFCLEQHVKMSPNAFFKRITESSSIRKSNYQSYWLNVKKNRSERHSEYLGMIPFSDFVAFEKILEGLPSNSQLQVGNSSAIRYTQLFDMNPSVSVYCNRGTSGIDGSTSTAIGASVVSNQRVTFITGDLSFFYDSNALWNDYIPTNFRIILINNGGGGIFRILPGHKNTDNFDTYFETKHELQAKHLCEMYGFDYCAANDSISLEKELKTFYDQTNKPRLLEIFTPRLKNDEILLNYFEHLK